MSSPPWYKTKRQAAAGEQRLINRFRVDRAYERAQRRAELESLRPKIEQERAARPITVSVPYKRDPRRVRPSDFDGGTWLDQDGKPTDPRIIRRAREAVTRHSGNPSRLIRILRPLARRFNPFDWLDFIEWMKQVVDPSIYDGGPKLNPGAGWYLRANCAAPMGPVNVWKEAFAFGANPTIFTFTAQCLSGQGTSGYASLPAQPVLNRANPRSISYAHQYEIVGGSKRLQLVEAWYCPANPPANQPDVIRQRGFETYADPNVLRGSPGVRPRVAPRANIATPDPVGNTRMMLETSTGGAGRAPPSLPWARLAPPGRRTHQGKTEPTGAAKWGLWLHRILDEVSEGAELIDAVYDSLPDEVKDRWERPDRMGDQFGQYGIEGLDWKLRALWYNWHKIDPATAVRNILKNHLSDKVIGGIQRRLPRNVGNAHEQGEMAFAQKLDQLLDYVLDNM